MNLYNISGATNKQLGKLEEAVEALQKSHLHQPDYTEAFNNLGNALKDQGKLEEAIEAYKKAISIQARLCGSI